MGRHHDNETYWLYVSIKRETEKALLCYDGEKDSWIPKSQIVDSEDDYGEGVITKIEVKAWICEDKGLNVDNSRTDVLPKVKAKAGTPPPPDDGIPF